MAKKKRKVPQVHIHERCGQTTSIQALLIFLTLAFAVPCNGQVLKNESALGKHELAALPEIENFSFSRFETRDKFDRLIRFYLSKTKSKQKLPLVICIQGSGGQSVFVEVETPNGKRIVSTGTETVAVRKFRENVRALVVEKPGIEFLFQPSRPGSAEESGNAYNRDFSLERWVEAVNASIEAAVSLPEIDSTRILALGHSEGGQVACEVAAINPRVTHVANMAGGGPTQLFDLMQQARKGDMYDPNATPENRVASLMRDWNQIQESPLATDRFILGHTHLRWSSFLQSSPITAILKSEAKVFVATGTADTNSLPASSEAFYCELLARGRDCTLERIEGADHGFATADDSNGSGWLRTNAKAIQWFLDDASDQTTNDPK